MSKVKDKEGLLDIKSSLAACTGQLPRHVNSLLSSKTCQFEKYMHILPQISNRRTKNNKLINSTKIPLFCSSVLKKE